MIFIETSVLVAAFQEFHVNHQTCFSLVSGARPKNSFTSAHCLTELYSVVTRMPPKFRASPELGMRFVRQSHKLLTTFSLDSEETLATIEEIASKGLSGGLVYDALIITCARKRRLSAFYTLNKRHFDAIAPDLGHLIREP